MWAIHQTIKMEIKIAHYFLFRDDHGSSWRYFFPSLYVQILGFISMLYQTVSIFSSLRNMKE